MRCAFETGFLSTVWFLLITPCAAQPRSSLSQRVEAVGSSIDKLIELEQAQALRWAEMEKSLAAHEKRLDELNGELAAARRDAADKEALVEQLQERTAGLDKEVASLRAELAADEKGRAEKGAEWAALKHDVAQRGAEGKRQQERIATLEATVGQLRARAATAEAAAARARRTAPATDAIATAYRARRPTNAATTTEDNRDKLQRLLAETEAIQSVRAYVAEFRAKNEEVLRAHRSAGAVNNYYHPAGQRPAGQGPVWRLSDGRSYRWP